MNQIILNSLKKISRNKKGEVNTVAVLVIIAVFLVITYPVYKNLINGFMTSVQTWFNNTIKTIFV
ncbi:MULTISPECIES: hypothetical protein [Clostridium]|uniref:hypothetical protein n=1 Tax=Clostridium TaxID=1485 RepID=UPI000824AD00|nr:MULTISPECIES: hypothetical protein [Clostridium]PJI10081.1 hypothetical protein CUB90_20380 [Clostridium sp. CT7]